MTNTLNTPIEALETYYPMRITEYRMRRGSGGRGASRGGDGLVRELECLVESSVSLLTDRRITRPWGLRVVATANQVPTISCMPASASGFPAKPTCA